MARVILLVEDDPTHRDVFRWVLQRAGYSVLDAARPPDALPLLEPTSGQTVDLVICDGHTPGPTILDFLRTLRAQYPELALIGLTTAEQAGLALAAALAGVRWLTKPVTTQRLLNEVTALLGPTWDAPAPLPGPLDDR